MNEDFGSNLKHPHEDPNRETVIQVKDLQVTFGTGRKKFVAVDNVNFEIYRGETFSLVGESGSGKTTIGRAITRINPTTAGEILYKGRKINGKISKEIDLEVIKGCQMIFQDPLASLNERAKVDYTIIFIRMSRTARIRFSRHSRKLAFCPSLHPASRMSSAADSASA